MADLRPALDAWLLDLSRVLRPRTVERYRATTRLLLAWLEQRPEPADTTSLSRSLLAAWWSWLTDDTARPPVATGTAIQYVRTVELAWAWLADHHDDLGLPAGEVPAIRRLRLPKRPRTSTPAPTWAEMDACIAGLDGWPRRAALLQRSTGMRIGETVRARWVDLDVERAQLRIPAAHTKGGYGGRQVPLPSHLLAEVLTWGRGSSTLVGTPAYELRRPHGAAKAYGQAWRAAGVRSEVWHGRPTHAFRRGYNTGLRQLGAEGDLVRIVMGHRLGSSEDAYVDPRLLRLGALAELVPVVAPPAVPSTDAARRVTPVPPPPASETAAVLLDWMAKRGLSQADLARALGVEISTTTWWLAHGKEPMGRQRQRLLELGAPLPDVEPPLTEQVLEYVRDADGQWTQADLAQELGVTGEELYSAVRSLRRWGWLEPAPRRPPHIARAEPAYLHLGPRCNEPKVE